MIEKHYGLAGRKLLMDCVKVNCFLSIMDPDTRDWASRLIGTKKVLKISNSEQQTQNGTSGRSVTEAREKYLNQKNLETYQIQMNLLFTTKVNISKQKKPTILNKGD